MVLMPMRSFGNFLVHGENREFRREITAEQLNRRDDDENGRDISWNSRRGRRREEEGDGGKAWDKSIKGKPPKWLDGEAQEEIHSRSRTKRSETTKRDVKPTEEQKAEDGGWGLNILVEHQKRMVRTGKDENQRKDGLRKGSFVDLIGDSLPSDLKLRDQERRSSCSASVTSSSGEQKESVISLSSNSTEKTALTSKSRTVSRESSTTSIGSSEGSLENVDGLLESLEDLKDGRRPSYKSGFSQRRIRGRSTGTQDSVKQENPAKELPCSKIIHDKQLEKSNVEQLFDAVKTNDEATVKSLHEAGVSLESLDKDGMTPLIVACLDGALFNMALTLIKLGANVRAYRFGIHAGYPLHHAAKRGRQNIVGLLLSHGAEPLAVNDDGQTALDMARIRGHASVVRVIEDWICLFKGVLRQITDNAGSQIMKRIWAVVLPSDGNPEGVSRHELAVYISRKVPMPESVILLGSFTSELEEPDFTLPDPSVVISDRVTRTKFKFLSQGYGDKDQLAEFYRACEGVPQTKNLRRSLQMKSEEVVPGRKSFSGTCRSANNDEGTTPTKGSRIAPAFPRSCSERPSLKKNLIFPEESLSTIQKKQTGQCLICKQVAADAISTPCGHLSGCMSCLSGVKGEKGLCPVCQAPIQHVVKVLTV